nr:hypothetical protein [Streptomyces sp. AC495_CC817]
MGLLDILLGRTKPVAPDLDRLFALPSAAVTLEAAASLTPTGTGGDCKTFGVTPDHGRCIDDQ